jgi:hypothetical protein
MNNKFIKVLIIINGILIPIFILFLLGNVLFDKYEKNRFDNTDSEVYEKDKSSFEIKYSSPKKILNSENYYVAISKTYNDIYDLDLGEISLDLVPKNTINIIFLDKEFNVIGKLLEKKGSISSMFVPDFHSRDKSQIKFVKNLSFYIAKEDTNSDGEINRLDQHYVYISDLNGEKLTKVTDRKVKQYQWINNNRDLLLTFKMKNEELEYGIYNIDKRTLTETKGLNPTQ